MASHKTIPNIKQQIAARKLGTSVAPDVHLAWYERLVGTIVAFFMGGF